MFQLILLYVIYRIISALLTSGNDQQYQNRSGDNGFSGSDRDDFLRALASLIAYMGNADGRFVKSELDYIKADLRRMFDDNNAQTVLNYVNIYRKNNISLSSATSFINKKLSRAYKLQILSLLYGIAMADGVMASEEWNLLARICNALHLSEYDLNEIQRIYAYRTYSQNSSNYDNGYNDGGYKYNNREQTGNSNEPSLAQAYKLLGVKESDTDAEIKKAYRVMAMKYHPDRVANAGKDVQEEAQRNFVKIQQAYDKICAARGIK